MFWKTEVNELQSDFFSSIECLFFVVYYPKKLCWLHTWSAIWQKLFSNLDEHMHHIFLQYCTDITLHIKLAIHQVCLETDPNELGLYYYNFYFNVFRFFCVCVTVTGMDQTKAHHRLASSVGIQLWSQCTALQTRSSSSSTATSAAAASLSWATMVRDLETNIHRPPVISTPFSPMANTHAQFGLCTAFL